MGEVGEVTGVVDAIVPPTPVLRVKGTALNLAVAERAVEETGEVAAIRAGL